MNPMRVIAFVVAVPLTATPQAAELRGRVVSESGEPVAGATVTLTALRYSLRTDSLGRFVLSGTPGATLEFSIRASGFRDDTRSVVLARRGAVTRDFSIVSESVALPEVNPSDRLLRGRVTTTEQYPLSYANIQLNGGRRFIADDSGRFSIPVNSERIRLIVRRIGFEPEEVRFDSMPDTVIRVPMRAVAAALPEITVRGRAAFTSLDHSGFYQRMKDAEKGINHGYFITPEDLDFRKPNLILNMAESIPAVRVEHNILTPRKDILKGFDNGGCTMTVYVDRIRIVGGMATVLGKDGTSGTERADSYVNELVLPNHVAGIEIYPRAVGAPPQYQSLNGKCGVVLIWTK